MEIARGNGGSGGGVSGACTPVTFMGTLSHPDPYPQGGRVSSVNDHNLGNIIRQLLWGSSSLAEW